MRLESCRQCIETPELARQCPFCGWVDNDGQFGQVGVCHRLYGRDERIIISYPKRMFDDNDLVIGQIRRSSEKIGFNYRPIFPSRTVREIRNRNY